MKTLRNALVTLFFSVFVIALFAQGNMTIQGGGAVTVNGNSYIIPTVFTCGNPLTDTRDGQIYSTVLIGSQCWMKQNLNYGTQINSINEQTNNNIPEKYCYDDLESNCDVYGGLYQWAEMVQYLNGATNFTSWSPIPTGNVTGICPIGWHIPSDAEWCQIETYLDATIDCNGIGWRGMDGGGKLKEAGVNHWSSPNVGATNLSGFTALPGGLGGNGPGFGSLNSVAYFWTSTESSVGQSYDRELAWSNSSIVRGMSNDKSLRFSVRCLKD